MKFRSSELLNFVSYELQKSKRRFFCSSYEVMNFIGL